jgi:hypothetical protein
LPYYLGCNIIENWAVIDRKIDIKIFANSEVLWFEIFVLGLWASSLCWAFERAHSLQSFLPQRQEKRIFTSIPQLFISRSLFSFYCAID